MLHKSFELLETKADGDHGEFTAIVSTFGNIDRVGDRIMPGAWTKTLEKWTASGDPIPIILAHQWNDPMAHIGVAHPQDVKQVTKGLQVTAKLDVDDNPLAKQVYKLMKRRSLKEFSIGYDVPQGGEKTAKDGVNEITEINLAECGPCLIGIDPKTELQSVKAALDAQHQPNTELQEVNARLEKIEKAVEDLSKKAEESGEDPVREGRQPDPLREHARKTAQDILRGDVDVQPPTQDTEEPPPSGLDPAVLRKESRDLIVQILSGGTVS